MLETSATFASPVAVGPPVNVPIGEVPASGGCGGFVEATLTVEARRFLGGHAMRLYRP